ncbi:CRISPR-associated CARF protein Csa3 [Halorussus salinus]|uniref:CRISPR-associated CARF protein Csa3 n=1 Tax=Halorussus salinus TaxID=1364935 RepID=UPI0010922573|nr:CRISPR-associated CARF protein Csa3 [Halorussus salinus]
MTTFVLPIGFDTRRITRPVVTHGVNADDTIILLRPDDDSDNEQSSRAIADVKQFLHEIEPNVTVSVKHVRRGDFTQTVNDCSEILAEVENPVVGLCGGPRDILLPLTVVSAVHADRLEQTYVFSDIDQSVQEWTLPPVTAPVPDAAAETLRSVAATGPCSLSTLAEQTDKSKSTVGRHLDTLEEIGLVRSWMEGKHRHIEITDAARLLTR